MSMEAGQARTWFVKVDGRVYGPYTSPQMRAYVGEGRVADYTLVSIERDGNWKPAADVEILKSWIDDARQSEAQEHSAEDPANLLVITRINSHVETALHSVLNRIGSAVEVVPGVWLVRARTTASALRNDLSHLLDRDDRLFVVDASRDKSAWFNFADDIDADVRRIWSGDV